jgi:hypothetical protein
MSPVIQKIKARGYWKMQFRPLEYLFRIENLEGCKRIAAKNAVLMRGWDFPHIPRREGEDTGLLPGENYYEGWVDWSIHKEIWRFYQSAQFICYRGLWEDWSDEDIIQPEPLGEQKKLSVLGTVYQVTEIYEFLAGLAREGLYREGLDVLIALFGTEQRELSLEGARASFMWPRRTAALTINYKKQHSETELIGSSIELAAEAILYIFQRFAWEPSRDLIRKEQEELMKRRRSIPSVPD